eukprot:1143440-Pelagomonas_calceolata.AAC.1
MQVCEGLSSLFTALLHAAQLPKQADLSDALIESLSHTQSAEGACYGVVPFVSRRSYGVVAGLVGAGGNTGSAVTQALFFADNEGLKPAKAGATEEDYYLAEWDAEEVAANLHIPSLRFAMESRSMRGKKLLETYLAKEEGLECSSQDAKKTIASIREDSN